MKRVVSKEMVSHLWANQSQDDARTSTDNFSFVGPLLYSYAQPIAYILPEQYTEQGRKIVLLNTSKYSVTTSKHKYLARYALRANVRTIGIPGLSKNMVCSFHRNGACEIIDALIQSIRSAASDAARPRIRPQTIAGHLERAENIRRDALLLLECDKAQARKLSKERRASIRKQAAELAICHVDFATPQEYAFTLNRATYLESFKESCKTVADIIETMKGEATRGEYSALQSSFEWFSRELSHLKLRAQNIGKPIPRALQRLIKSVDHGTAWRAEVNAGWQAYNIAQARAKWAESETALRAAMETRSFSSVSFQARAAKAAAETLHMEDGDAERRAFLVAYASAADEWNAKNEMEIGDDLSAAAVQLFDKGDFIAARSVAERAIGRYLGAYSKEIHAGRVVAPIEAMKSLVERAQGRIGEQLEAQLAQWRDAVPGVPFPHGVMGDNYWAALPCGAAFLRISADRRRIETSMGAEVPMSVCAMLWRIIGQQRAAGESRAFTDVRLGHFWLDRVDANGDVHAGCHFIPYAELADIAARLGYAAH